MKNDNAMMTKAEKTKQYIIERTAPIFNRKGFAGTSMNDIIEATGLTKGSIYGNFDSKDDVALAAFDYNFGAVSSMIRIRMAAKPHSVDKLKVYLTVFSDFVNLPLMHGGCPVLNTAIESDDTHGQLRAKAVGAIENWYKNIEDVIKHGVDMGQIKQGTNAKDFAGAFIALIEGGMMLAKVTGKMHGLKAAVKQGEKMIGDITA
ncbi:TetR/AcrR family transcriptional regulator [Flavobacterium sp. DG1-102-2]|uniref:TetR/AcrR family transcriptional regulator n=1 Tax=Flavobacterium sp. DG1-102-2 TaxID=3081663 RepID=UPI00294A1FB0|nr:TetR/AcrR family transcriptional regulator [Flavobacterium sp. DG1-102-2]MDV6169455.1 TetR/AcrR family transcriptional regulator [Flavobacterium sp. DG1-102-2]